MKQTTNNPQAAGKTLNELRDLFKPHLDLPKARLTCLLMLVLTVIKQRTVSLVWLSKHTSSNAKADSVYRRFQRFFRLCRLRPKMIGRIVLALVPKPHNGWILAMDRTNWKFGKSHINILVVSIILGGVGIPIAWKVLPKKTKCGNSHKGHRIRVIKDVLELMDATDIRVLTMDREFVGKLWLSWLRDSEVRYIVRVKRNARIGKHSAAHLSDRNRWRNWKNRAEKRYTVFGQQVHFAATRIDKGRDTHLAVISYGFCGEQALELYRLRWGIETLFGHLKKKGYQLEDTHMTKGVRIEKLVGVLTLSFLLCYRWGQKLKEQAGIKLKKHGYRAKSVFRQGFESLHEMLVKPLQFIEGLARCLTIVLIRPLTENFVV